MNLDIKKELFKIEFPEQKLLDELLLYKFLVPIVPELGIVIPGSIRLSVK